MRTFLMSLAVGLAVAVSIWMSAGHSAFSAPVKSQPTASLVTPNPITESVFDTAALNSGSERLPVVELSSSEDPSAHSVHQDISMNAPVSFFALPKEMQKEITQLSGRDEANHIVNEVSPGVFLMSKGPRVVPVAVINEDGTVSVHEY